MIWGFVQDAVFKSLTKNVKDFTVNHPVATELLVGFEFAHSIVCIAFVDSWNTAEFLVVPWILRLVGFDDCF